MASRIGSVLAGGVGLFRRAWGWFAGRRAKIRMIHKLEDKLGVWRSPEERPGLWYRTGGHLQKRLGFLKSILKAQKGHEKHRQDAFSAIPEQVSIRKKGAEFLDLRNLVMDALAYSGNSLNRADTHLLSQAQVISNRGRQVNVSVYKTGDEIHVAPSVGGVELRVRKLDVADSFLQSARKALAYRRRMASRLSRYRSGSLAIKQPREKKVTTTIVSVS